MNKASVVALCAAMALSACSSTPQQKSFNVNAANFSSAKVEDLCATYGFRMNRAADAKQELIRRGIFSGNEWALIDAQKVEPGLSECGVKAAWPLNVARYTFLKDPSGKQVEVDMIYACDKVPAPYCPFTMVQIRDGRVTAVVQVAKL